MSWQVEPSDGQTMVSLRTEGALTLNGFADNAGN